VGLTNLALRNVMVGLAGWKTQDFDAALWRFCKTRLFCSRMRFESRKGRICNVLGEMNTICYEQRYIESTVSLSAGEKSNE
jgi:hypothetical protein